MNTFISAWRRSTIIITFSLTVSFLSASCSNPKFSECKQLNKIATEISHQVIELSDNRTTKNPEKVLEVADVFEEGAQVMESLELKDTKLQEYQRNFAQFYRNQAQVTRDFIAARDRKDISAAELAQQNVQKLGKTEEKLVTQINNYCLPN
ncbi:MAG: hypothetical protein AB4038_01295 [Prochloraceae cyanobacterium]